MILLSLEITNFKKFKSKRFEFSEGLTGILGRNGSGKSTIFEAIFFALYGTTKAKELIRHSSASPKDPVEVELKFEIEGKDYRVKREFRGRTLTAKAALYDAKDELISSSSSEVTKSITSLVGLDKQAFKQTVFASQKELTSLSSLNQDERKKMMRELLGLEKIDRVEALIKEKMLTLRREIEALTGVLLREEELDRLKKEAKEKSELLVTQTAKLEKLKHNEEQLKRSAKEIATTLERWQKLKEEKLHLENLVKNASTRVIDQKESIEKLRTKQKELHDLSKRFDNEKNLLQQYEALNKKLQLLNEKKLKIEKKEGLKKEQEALRGRYKSLKREIKELEQFISQKSSVAKEIESKQKEIEKLKQEQKKIEQEIEQLQSQIKKDEGVIAHTKSQMKKIQELGRESECPTCTRKLLDEYDSVIDSLNQKINTLTQTQIANAQKRLEPLVLKRDESGKEIEKNQKSLQESQYILKTIESKERELNTKIREFRAVEDEGQRNKRELEALEKITYDENEHKSVLKERDALEPRYRELLGIKGKIEELVKVEAEIKSATKRLQELESRQKSAQAKLKESKYNEKEHLAVKDENEKLKEMIEKSHSEVLKLSTTVTALKGEIKSIEDTIERDKKQRADMESKIAQRADYEKLKAYLQSFKDRINAHIAPRISSYASSMFADITRGKYQHIEVDSEFNFYIYDEGVKYPIERFSGGEIDLANLVLRIAISRSVSELGGGKSIGFLAFDEVFGSQDEERRYEIMEAFHKIKERYREIFLISHESEIKEMFERVIEL